ncbi:MAG: hypothetical protein ACTS27_04495 [Phycisphaerales bacterium]
MIATPFIVFLGAVLGWFARGFFVSVPVYSSNYFDHAYVGRCIEIVQGNPGDVAIYDICNTRRSLVPPAGLSQHSVTQAIMGPGRKAILVEIGGGGAPVADPFFVIEVWSGRVHRGDWIAMANHYAALEGVSAPQRTDMRPSMSLFVGR